MATLKTRTAGGATEASKASPGLGEAAARAAWRSLAQAGQGRGSERLLRTGRPPSLGRLEDKNKPNPPQEQLSRLPPPAPGRGSVPLFPPPRRFLVGRVTGGGGGGRPFSPRGRRCETPAAPRAALLEEAAEAAGPTSDRAGA